MKTFYITTPIYYANSSPHLGHLYTTIVADVIARYKKQRGYETFFLTGTDEHGLNIQRAAEQNKRTPKEQVDFVSGEIKKLFHDFKLDKQNGGYDIFMRTSEPFHYEGAQNLWRKIAPGKTPKGNPAIYKGKYEGWFCAACASFKMETEYEKSGDENSSPICLMHEKPLDRVEEESYMFRLSDFGEVLDGLIEGREVEVAPEARRNEVLSFIRRGLQDLSISRQRKSVSWGIPVPDDPEHVMYVWLDALSNYITAIGYGNKERSSLGFDKFWANTTHLVGKDILRFHTVYWFSFLLAAGLPLPKKVYAHGLWLDAEGRKMSKTIGNVIEPMILHKYFSVDSTRYFLLREMVFGQDGKFSYEAFIERTNADLASGLGNLASRTLTMITKYRGGVIPDGYIADANSGFAKRVGVSANEKEIAGLLVRVRDEFIRDFENFDFSIALESVWSAIAYVDKMISDAKPWELAKDESQLQTLSAVLFRACETLRWLCVLLFPVMPESARNIYGQLGLTSDLQNEDPAQLKWSDAIAGVQIGETKAVFPRVDKDKVMSEIKTETTVSPDAKPALAETAAKQDEGAFIAIDDFLKVELRVGEILVAEKIPDADKLLRFEIDLGEAKPRQILAGLAQYYDPEKLIGRKVVVVANLKPRKMRGLESQGMVCAASLGEEDSPALATFLENVKVGARLK